MSLDIDITYILVLALFLVPLLVLNALVFKPFMKLFEERHEQLEGAEKRIKDLIKEVEAQAETFRAKIKVATNQGIEARNKIRSQAQDEMNAALEAERNKVGERVAAALSEVEQKRQESMSNVRSEAQKLAEITAAKLLGRSI